MYSLQSRLSIWLTLLLIAIFGIHIAVMGYFPRYLAEEHILTRLQHDAESFTSRLQLHPKKGLYIRGSITAIYQTPASGHYFQAEKAGQLLLSPSLTKPLIIPTDLNKNKASVFHLTDANGVPLLGWRQTIMRDGYEISLIFAEDIQDIEEDIGILRQIYFFGTILAILLIIILQRFIIRREMRPVEQARQQLSAIEQGKQQRLTQTLPSEIQPLVDELNHLLEVMERRLKRSRHATGNLAHALKTPLSVLMQLTDTKEIQANRELAHELTDISTTIQSAINRELKRARLAGASLAGQTFKFNEEIPTLIEVMKKVYADKNPDIQLHLPSQQSFQADREDMLELFGNLLDNACKWAAYCVTVTIETQQHQTGLGVRFSIEDDGAGISKTALNDLTQRGTRLDEAMPGHGLGLAIVKEIVEQYNGKIAFDASPTLGGLKVIVSF